MGIVVGRVDAPLSGSSWVRGELDPVGHWVHFTVHHDHLHTQCGLMEGGRSKEEKEGGRRREGREGVVDICLNLPLLP